MRVVLDTNALVSALGWEGNPRAVFSGCVLGTYLLVESRDLLKEFLDVILRQKFSYLSREDIREFSVHLLQVCELVEPKRKLSIVREDPKDNIVLECAAEGKVDYIVSGDKHLLDLKEFEEIKIVTPAEFLKLLNDSGLS